MEIRLKIDDDFMQKLKDNLGGVKTNQLTQDALALLNWAVSETKQGRVIVSTDNNGDNVKQLAMPSLERIKEK